MRRRARRLLFGLAIAAVIGAILILGWRPVPPPPVIGMVRATEIKIAPEVSGRIAQILVKAGDRVQAGTVVAQLSNPELAAAVEEARATVGAARAARDHVYAGIRQEQVKITAREVDKAKADLLLAQQEYQRTSAVAKAGYASTQRPPRRTSPRFNRSSRKRSMAPHPRNGLSPMHRSRPPRPRSPCWSGGWTSCSSRRPSMASSRPWSRNRARPRSLDARRSP
jgi:hypothetical protein